MTIKKDFFNYDYNDLLSLCSEHNLKPFLAKQLYDWVYKKFVFDFDKMTNISKQNIFFLKDFFYFSKLKVDQLLKDKDGTVKFLFELEDGNKIESVIMNFEYGNSLCVTSQVGCNMGCKFCASGQLKKIRNLIASEIVLQLMHANLYLLQNNLPKIRNIVVMGIGEPLDNYDNLKKFLNIIRDDLGLALGSRKITISTCGLVKKLKTFVNEFPQVGIAISLHAPNDLIRNQLMPINQVYNINEIITTSKDIIKSTNRRITFEYIMLKGINDTKECAQQLGKLLKGILCYVNLIPYNSVDNTSFQRSDNIKTFINELKKYKIIVTVRQEKGSDINGACGQLRAKSL